MLAERGDVEEREVLCLAESTFADGRGGGGRGVGVCGSCGSGCLVVLSHDSLEGFTEGGGCDRIGGQCVERRCDFGGARGDGRVGCQIPDARLDDGVEDVTDLRVLEEPCDNPCDVVGRAWEGLFVRVAEVVGVAGVGRREKGRKERQVARQLCAPLVVGLWRKRPERTVVAERAVCGCQLVGGIHGVRSPFPDVLGAAVAGVAPLAVV